MQTRQDGEYRLLALQDLLVQHVVSLIQLNEARCAEYYEYGVDVLKLVFAVVDGYAQMLGCSGCKDVSGVSH